VTTRWLSSGIWHQQFSNRYCVRLWRTVLTLTTCVASPACWMTLRRKPVDPVNTCLCHCLCCLSLVPLSWGFTYNRSEVKFCVHFQSRGKQRKRLVLTRRQKTQLALSQYVSKCNASVICHKYLTLLSSSVELMPRSKSYSWVDDSTAVSEQHRASTFWFFIPLRNCQCRQHFPLKHCDLCARLHDVTFHYTQLSPPGVHQITLICLVSC
jgi:hypothetical protein